MVFSSLAKHFTRELLVLVNPNSIGFRSPSIQNNNVKRYQELTKR